VFGVLKILNIAHGSFYALGAYGAATTVAWAAGMKFSPWMSLVAMLLAAVAIAAFVAPLVERGLLRFFYGRDEVLLVLTAPRRFVWKETFTMTVGSRARWACGQVAWRPVHMPTGRC
jgi:branched-chain amino acid transport system permease protein